MRIFLVRHAHAGQRSPGMNDRYRTLSPTVSRLTVFIIVLGFFLDSQECLHAQILDISDVEGNLVQGSSNQLQNEEPNGIAVSQEFIFTAGLFRNIGTAFEEIRVRKFERPLFFDTTPELEQYSNEGYPMQASATGISISPSGAVFLCGNTAGILPGSDGSDVFGGIFLSKFQIDEEFGDDFEINCTTVWNQTQPNQFESATGVVADGLGNVYVCGFVGVVDSTTTEDIVVLKYNESLEEQPAPTQ